MLTVLTEPTIILPPSKSAANRALVLAFLSMGIDGTERVWKGISQYPRPLPDDIHLMYEALKTLAASHSPSAAPILQVGAAGTVLRFLLPIVALHRTEPVRFAGSCRLFQRPLTPLLKALARAGASWQTEVDGGLLMPPKLVPDNLEFDIDGSMSSQFISGLAMSVAGLPRGGIIRWKSGVASRHYLHLTKLWLERFGCQTSLNDNSIEIQGGLKHKTQKDEEQTEICGDWSAAAVVFCAAAILEKELEAGPLDDADGQPDAAILKLLKTVGCSWRFDGLRCTFTGRLNGAIDADLFDCPDLAPPLAALAVFAPEVSCLRGLDTLPHKESDRLLGIEKLVEWLGGRTELLSSTSLKIYPLQAVTSHKSQLAEEPFDPMDDHRLAFAAAIGALKTGGTILNLECVNKSWPTFNTKLHPNGSNLD